MNLTTESTIMTNRDAQAGGAVGGRRARGVVGSFLIAAALVGCDGLLEVDNPNNLSQDDLSNPAAAGPLVNGASATVARALGAMYGPYSTATDEVTWIGSRDAWRELDEGFLSNERNEFTDQGYHAIAEGRFMADEAILRLSAFDAEDELGDRNLLARAYLIGAIAYTAAADMFDTFVISDRRDANPPIAPGDMDQLYDTAVQYANAGLAVAQATGEVNLQAALMGMRARAKFSKAVWAKLNPAGSTPADPLVSDAGATADAQAALALMVEDYRYVMTLDNDDIAYGPVGEPSLAYNLNQRGELGIDPVYGTLGANAGATLEDPIDGIPSPVLDEELKTLAASYVYHAMTIVSAREMYLILAEAALDAGNAAGFITQINMLRALDGLTPYAGQVDAEELLEHSRRTNLFLQGRRLSDQYRFGSPSSQWGANSTARTTPGTFFPVTCTEISSHPEDFPGVSC